MAKILLIETATGVCSVAVAVDGQVVTLKETNDSRSHAEFITLFIADVMTGAGLTFSQLDAVAVSRGPGSYTGLRIGVSTAKGICYAADLPLIGVDTLRAMASGMRQHQAVDKSSDYLLCPMIDARRMEVYAAVYDDALRLVMPTEAIVVDSNSFSGYLSNQTVYFGGDGEAKCRQMLSDMPGAVFLDHFLPSAAWMAEDAFRCFISSKFENLAYFEPFYLKDFVAGLPRVKGLR